MQNTEEIYDSSNRPFPLIEEIQALIMYRELLYQLVAKSIKTRYKRSFLGVVWTMLNPILTMIVLSIVFSTIFKFSIENYPIYILCGLTAWNFFSSATNEGMGDMLWSGNMLTRIYMPKSSFAVSALGVAWVNMVIALIPLFVIAVIMGVDIQATILVIPIAIVILMIFALGIALLLSTAVVYFADILPIYGVLLSIWFYATPIIYPVEIIPENLTWIYLYNPMFYLVEIFRAPIFEGIIPDISTWLLASGISMLTLLVGSLVFTSKSHEYGYRI